MKHISTLSLLAVSMSGTAQAEVIIPCDGTYATSQAWLADIGGTSIQGARGLGSIKLKVLECGNTITISADGMSVSLNRATSGSNTFKGKHKGTPNLEFTLNAKTPQHLNGKMIASDGHLALKRPLAVILQSGSTPKLDNCTVENNAADSGLLNLSLVDLFKHLKLLPKSGLTYSDYIHNGSNTGETQSSAYFYLDRKQSVLAKFEKKQLVTSCTGSTSKENLAILPKLKARFNIVKQDDRTNVQLQIIDVSSEFKIVQEHSLKVKDESKENVSNAMIALWKSLIPTIKIKSMAGSI